MENLRTCSYLPRVLRRHGIKICSIGTSKSTRESVLQESSLVRAFLNLSIQYTSAESSSPVVFDNFDPRSRTIVVSEVLELEAVFIGKDES